MVTEGVVRDMKTLVLKFFDLTGKQTGEPITISKREMETDIRAKRVYMSFDVPTDAVGVTVDLAEES